MAILLQDNMLARCQECPCFEPGLHTEKLYYNSSVIRDVYVSCRNADLCNHIFEFAKKYLSIIEEDDSVIGSATDE